MRHIIKIFSLIFLTITFTVAIAYAEINKAVAVINPTEGNSVTGIVTFVKIDGGIQVTASLDNLSEGKHGFHIHEFGDCSSLDGTSAGGHFNPLGKQHGAPESGERHAGDLGNIIADGTGHAEYDRIDSSITLDGENPIIGRGVIVHAGEDDLTSQPTGNAGGRLACGVIEIAE